MLFLTTTGRRSGHRRTMPLIYRPDGDDSVLVASNGGRRRHPAWWLNLRSDPESVIAVRRKRLDLTARAATPEETPRLGSLMSAVYTTDGYTTDDSSRARTTRVVDVAVVMLRG